MRTESLLLWDLMFYRNPSPDVEDHIAFANRQIRRKEIIEILTLEKLASR